jgi:hypothetical protein
MSVCLALTVAGCSTTKADKPPVCDGKHRRPANIYGSVLSPEGTADAAKPQALSAAPTPNRSCA